MATDPEQPTQKTRPYGIDKATGRPHKPVEIPVPTRDEVFDLLRGVIGKRPSTDDGSGSEQ